MTTSDYLLVQQDLLIAFRLMRLARVEDALSLARAAVTTGRPLLDQWGQVVATDPARIVVLCEAVLGLLAMTGRDVIPRKPPASETVAADRAKEAVCA